MILRINYIKQFPKEVTLSAFRDAFGDLWEILLVAKRDGSHKTLVTNTDDVRFIVGTTVGMVRHVAHHIHPGHLPQHAVHLDARIAVVIARRNNDGHVLLLRTNVQQGVHIHLLHFGGRIANVENIATDYHHIGLMCLDYDGNLMEKRLLFFGTVVTV